MKLALIVIGVLLLIGLGTFGWAMGVAEHLGDRARGGKCSLVAGGRRIAAPRRPDSEPGRDRQRFRQAGAGGDQGSDRRSRGLGRRAHPAGKNRGQWSIGSAPQPAAGGGRELSAASKSNENFLRLQDELAGTENRIAVERRKYNETVQKYNTDIALFPNNVAASMFGFQRNDAYFKTEPGARNAPKVAF